MEISKDAGPEGRIGRALLPPSTVLSSSSPSSAFNKQNGDVITCCQPPASSTDTGVDSAVGNQCHRHCGSSPAIPHFFPASPNVCRVPRRLSTTALSTPSLRTCCLTRTLLGEVAPGDTSCRRCGQTTTARRRWLTSSSDRAALLVSTGVADDESSTRARSSNIRQSRHKSRHRRHFYNLPVAYSGALVWNLIVFGLVACFVFPLVSAGCDRMFVSNPGGKENGTFSAPLIQNPEEHAQQCIYTFVARPGYRVEVVFRQMDLRGAPPECGHEYIDVYTEIKNPNSTDLINTPHGGRYCGDIPPRRRVSFYRTIAIGFYSDRNATEETLFGGTYRFVPEANFTVGTRDAGAKCGYVIRATNKTKKGSLVSPTYPGVYPKNMMCYYKFYGQKGQRIRIEFRDFDLFFGGPHCPFDVVDVFDGPDETYPRIGSYCGQRRNLVIFSSKETLYMTFSTLQRTEDAQNRGFSGLYEFSESFVKLDFITETQGEHMRGTECDQKVLSQRLVKNGTIVSPNYPYPYIQNIICRYFVYGMEDMQNLERVRIEFVRFGIDSVSDGKCKNAFLKVYLRGQEEKMEYDKPDETLCGDKLPPRLRSYGPRMLLVFSSGQTQEVGFKLNYKFETEYQVPGTAAPDGSCTFTYVSTSQNQGEFNSPRHPSNYPSNTTCAYIFEPQRGEQVRLIFDIFKVKADNAAEGRGNGCQEDWVEISNEYHDGTSRLLGRYCNTWAPGPIESMPGAKALKVVLRTNEADVASGFKARYIFNTRNKSILGDCGANISKTEDGEVTTPGWPGNYVARAQTCNWYIHSKPGRKIMLRFETFMVEGDPSSRGCPGATVRVWANLSEPPLELCGESLTVNQSQLISTDTTLRVTFITADKAVGAQGFRAVWTQIKDGPDCDGFLCSTSGFCIDNSLRCNLHNNCGTGDNSDEEKCVQAAEINVLLLLSVGLGIASVFVIGLCVCCHRKRKRRRPDPLGVGTSPHRHLHICDRHSLTGLRYATHASSVDTV